MSLSSTLSFLLFLMSAGATALADEPASVEADSNHPSIEKIVGGQPGTLAMFPFQAVIRERNQVKAHCGASILGPHYLLTAAHCFVVQTSNGSYVTLHPDRFEILSATDDLRSPRARSSIVKLIFFGGQHKYDPASFRNDILMIRVQEPLQGRTIGIPRPGTEFGGEAIVSGFGALREGGQSPFLLQFVKVHLVSSRTCAARYKDYDGSVNICAGVEEGGKDSCQGDSGGPLIARGPILIGVVSYGDGCARSGVPGVYTRVAAYFNLIQQVLRS